MVNGNGNGLHSVPQSPTTREVLWDQSAPDSVRVVKVTTPKMLAEVWPWVRQRLERIKKKDKSAGNWTSEHVRFALLQGMAKPPGSLVELFLAVDEGTVIRGFIVTVVRIDQYLNIPWTLYIWLGSLNRGLMRRFLPWLEEMARERGLSEIKFESGRFGWMGTIGHLPESGFYCESYTFTKELR